MSRFERLLAIVAIAATAALVATPATAQESVFNLPGFGLPGTGESMRGRALGGAALGLGGETFSLENPAVAAGFGRAGAHLSFLGHRATIEDRTSEGDVEDVAFPMGQVVVPAWGRSAVTIGFYQFLDFDAVIDGRTVFEGDTVGVTFEAEGGISVLSPGIGWSLDEKTALGATIDVYLGSREVIRGIDLSDVVDGAVATSDTLARDFSAVGFTIGAERRIGDRAQVSAAYKFRPTVESDVIRGLGLEEGDEGILPVDIELPGELVIGGAARLSSRLLATAVYRYAGWSGATGTIGTEAEVDDAIEVGGGLELRPESSILGLFGPTAPLRVGARWRRLPLVLEGTQVTEWSLTGGYGRSFGPDRRGRVDLSVEFGRRGDLDEHGLAEEFVRFGVGVSAFDPWQRGGGD